MNRTALLLVAIATLLALCYASLWAGPAHEPGVLGFLTLMAVAFALYAIACRVARRVPEHPALAIILGGAVLFRALTAGPVLFDDDLYRYHWDGKVLASGRNPYAYAPNDHRLGGLRDDAWERVSYKYVRTIYPPLTEALTAGSYLVWKSPARIRVLASLFDIATLVPILLILRRLRLPLALVIIYAWNPLPIKEFANSGHLDSVAVFCATWSLYALICGRSSASGALWGLSLLGKTWSAVFWPLFVRRERVWAVGVCAVVVLVGLLPFAGAGPQLLSGSATYAGDWEFNSGLFAMLQAAANHIGLPGRIAAKLLGGALWVAAAGLVLAANAGDASTTLRQAALLIGVTLIVSPVCNPWYVCWLLPILCVHRSPAWLAFSGLVMLSYAYYLSPAWDPMARLMEYAVFAGLLLWEQQTRSPHRLWAGLHQRDDLTPTCASGDP